MIQVPGKRNRRVPIILTPEVKQAMNVLVKYRGSAGIPANNPYFFPADSSRGHLTGGKVLKSVAISAEVQHPERITSTNLRKYCATVTQVNMRIKIIS